MRVLQLSVSLAEQNTALLPGEHPCATVVLLSRPKHYLARTSFHTSPQPFLTDHEMWIQLPSDAFFPKAMNT